MIRLDKKCTEVTLKHDPNCAYFVITQRSGTLEFIEFTKILRTLQEITEQAKRLLDDFLSLSLLYFTLRYK